jgi:YaiO family outer membrane protein
MQRNISKQLGRSLAMFAILLWLPCNLLAADVRSEAFDNYVEGGIKYDSLTNGFDDWKGGYLQGAWQQDQNNIWDWEILYQKQYGASGNYYVAGLTHVFDQDWYGSVHVGASGSGFFFPDYRVDAAIHRKLLPQRDLVLTVGTGYIEQKDSHSDKYLYLGAGYYFPDAWLIEGGVRLNQSSPGSVSSSRYLLALSRARDKIRHIAISIDWGDEAYLAIGPTTSLVDFPSTLLMVNWREWYGPDYGLHVIAEYYDSDVFNRTGVTIGVFKEF